MRSSFHMLAGHVQSGAGDLVVAGTDHHNSLQQIPRDFAGLPTYNFDDLKSQSDYQNKFHETSERYLIDPQLNINASIGRHDAELASATPEPSGLLHKQFLEGQPGMTAVQQRSAAGLAKNTGRHSRSLAPLQNMVASSGEPHPEQKQLLGRKQNIDAEGSQEVLEAAQEGDQ